MRELFNVKKQKLRKNKSRIDEIIDLKEINTNLIINPQVFDTVSRINIV